MGLSREKKRKQWEETIQDWETSGKSVLGYCREHGIPHWKLFYWKERLRKKDKRAVDPIVRAVFVELSDNKLESSGISLSLNGITLQLCRDYDEVELLRTLHVLESR